MRGRPITNNSAKAQKNREHMRRVREAQKAAPRPAYQPLAQVIATWRTQ